MILLLQAVAGGVVLLEAAALHFVIREQMDHHIMLVQLYHMGLRRDLRCLERGAIIVDIYYTSQV